MKLRKPIAIGEHLIVDPRVCFGKLTFKGTRVPVSTILHFLSEGRTIEEILAGWPYLKREAIVEAIQLASEALAERSLAQAKSVNEPARSGRTS